MSVATSLPCIRIPHTSSPSPSSSSSSSATPTTTSCLRLPTSSTKPYYHLTIRSSQAEGPVRRPVAPSPTPPLKPNPPPTPTSSSSPPPPPAPPSKPAASQVVVDDKDVVTLEFQRQKAKELQDYFKQKKIEDSNQGPFFGFIGKNEISNGRWAMFGFAVGMLTEYATGSDFVDQVKILLSNFGILDLE